MLLIGLSCSTWEQTVKKAVVRCSRVLLNVVPACPMGMTTNSTLSLYFLRLAMGGEFFMVFSICLLSHMRSLHYPTFTRMRVHGFLSTFI